VGYRKLSFDGASIEYVVNGPADAPKLLIFHVGTPQAAVDFPALTSAAAAAGMRTATYSRGGYGRSSRITGRTVADEAGITAALADHLGHELFFTLGWSGGGPVALAAAALLPERVLACGSMAGISPRIEAGAEWRTFPTPEQLKDWDELAAGDLDQLVPDFEGAVGMFSHITVKGLRRLGGPADARALANDVVTAVDEPLVRSMRRSVASGYFGFLDDNLAQAHDWGFRVADIRVPVVIRHGALDRLVPAAHGRWLASAIPGARGVFLDDAGHGSIALPWSDVVDELVEAARLAG
jgi:pimeloyl-ACP methyl ester carboxylesterase